MTTETETEERPKLVPESERLRGLFYPVDMTPEEFFRELGRVRKDAEAQVERLIDVLDSTAGCPDLEDSADDAPNGDEEPSLGSIDNATNQEKWALPGDYTEHNIDLEGEHDGREPDDEPEVGGGDNQPSMGWAQNMSQALLQSTVYDGESEPSLGSFDRMIDQSKSWRQHDGPSMLWAVTDGEVGDSDR